MKQKNAAPDKEQQAVLRQNGLNPLYWVVAKDLRNTMIIKHRFTGEFRTVNRK